MSFEVTQETRDRQMFKPRAKRKRGDPRRDSDRVYIMGLRLARDEDDWITDFAAGEQMSKQDVVYRALRNLFANERQKDNEMRRQVQANTDTVKSLAAYPPKTTLATNPAVAYNPKPCPRCGVGIDDDGDGNCGRCAKLSDEQAANLRRLQP